MVEQKKEWIKTDLKLEEFEKWKEYLEKMNNLISSIENEFGTSEWKLKPSSRLVEKLVEKLSKSKGDYSVSEIRGINQIQRSAYKSIERDLNELEIDKKWAEKIREIQEQLKNKEQKQEKEKNSGLLLTLTLPNTQNVKSQRLKKQRSLSLDLNDTLKSITEREETRSHVFIPSLYSPSTPLKKPEEYELEINISDYDDNKNSLKKDENLDRKTNEELIKKNKGLEEENEKLREENKRLKNVISETYLKLGEELVAQQIQLKPNQH